MRKRMPLALRQIVISMKSVEQKLGAGKDNTVHKAKLRDIKLMKEMGVQNLRTWSLYVQENLQQIREKSSNLLLNFMVSSFVNLISDLPVPLFVIWIETGKVCRW